MAVGTDESLKVANAAKSLAEQNDGWIARNGKIMQEFMDKCAKRVTDLEDKVKKIADENKSLNKTVTGMQKEVNALKKKK